MKKERQKFRFSKKMGMVLIVATLLFACTKSTDKTINNNSNNNGGSVNCTGVAQLFSTDVNPIIQSTCATGSSCHGTGSINGPGELRTYSEIASAHVAIRAAVLSGLMPKTGSLTSAQKNTIICWIDNGALNN